MEPLGIWQAISLGTLQGLTEFLPVSSSGHLVVAQQWLGLTLPARALAAFDVALHAGTLFAVVCYYWKDLIKILTGRAWHLVGLLVIGTIPAAAIGIPLKAQVEALFTSVTVVGIAWLATGTVLWLTQYVRPVHFAHGFEESTLPTPIAPIFQVIFIKQDWSALPIVLPFLHYERKTTRCFGRRRKDRLSHR